MTGWPIVEVVDPREEPPGTGLLTGPLATALHHAVDHGGRAVCLAEPARPGAAPRVRRVQRARAAASGAARSSRRPTTGTLRCARLRARAPGHLPALPRDPAQGAAARRVAGPRGPGRVAAPGGGGRGGRVDRPISAAGRSSSARRRCCTGCRPGPPVLLAAFLDFDQELLAPRYRAAEQALGLLARAARRVGPRAGGGRLLDPDPAARPRGARGRPAGRPDARRRGGAAPPPGARVPAVRRAGRGARRGRAPVTTLIDGLRELDGHRRVRADRRAATGLQALLHARGRRAPVRRARPVARRRPGPRGGCGSRSTRCASEI